MQLSLWTDAHRVAPATKAPKSRSKAGARRLQPETPETSSALCTAPTALEERAQQYVEAAHTDATRKAYQRDWDAFELWCRSQALDALPASAHTLELYLAHLAELGRRASTIRRARKSVGLAHGHAGLQRPDQHARIRALERGIGRVHGSREEGAPPLLEDELAQIVRTLGHSPRDDRDRAMLLLGFAGAFRCSELAGLNIDQLRFTKAGLEVLVARSKEDQLGKGATTEIPYGSHESTCPVQALKCWMARVGRPAGPLFRVVQGATIEHQRIHPKAVTRAVQRAVARAGLQAGYSSHSLRAGLATSAYAHGSTRREIQLQGRWQDPRSVDRYIRIEHVPGRRNVVEGLL